MLTVKPGFFGVQSVYSDLIHFISPKLRSRNIVNKTLIASVNLQIWMKAKTCHPTDRLL